MQNVNRICALIARFKGLSRSALASPLFLLPLLIAVSTPAIAQDSPEAPAQITTPTAPVVPQQVRYAGKLAARPGDTVEAVFRIYAAAEGGDPLWTETQQVTLSEDGSYSVLLGGANSAGLPQAVFAGGAARWLGVSVDRSPEQERVLLSSVPYAMKSADAESLSGHPASDFVTQSQLAAQINQVAAQSVQAGNVTPAITPDTSGTVTGSGTAGTVPLWTGTLTQGNSEIYQVGSDIGINETAPTATLDVNGTENVRGTVNLPALATATSTTGQRSQLIELSASAWSSTAKAPVSPTFKLLTNFVNNNTSSAGGQLEFHYGNGTASNNVLTIAGTGVISFAPGQTFPGTIASVTGTSPITATTTSGAVSLGLNTSALEATLNSVYPQLGTASSFSAQQTFNGGLTSNAYVGAASITGNGTDGVAGLEGTTDTGNGVYGSASGAGYAGYFVNNTTADSTIYAVNNATGNPGLSIALKGYVPYASSIAVMGKAVGSGSYGVFGENVGGTDANAVYGSATGPGSNAVYGSSTGTSDPSGAFGTGVVGVSTSGSGVEGSSHGLSGMGSLQKLAPAGVWGDYGAPYSSNNLGATGVAGTADNNYAGTFQNDSDGVPTLYVENNGSFEAAFLQNTSTSNPTLEVVAASGSATTNSAAAASLTNYSNSNATLYLVNNGTGPTGPVSNISNSTGTFKPTGIFTTLMASTTSGACGIGGDGDLSCTGQVKSLVSTGGGARKVESYAMQSPENWMEDFGSANLEKGVAVVTLDPAFAETVTADSSYHVFLTPNGDSKGLYVISKTPTTFEVRESGGGTSSLSFDFRITAKRRGYEAQRLKDVTDEFNQAKSRAAESVKPSPQRPSPMKHQGAPAPSTGLSNTAKALLEAPEHPAQLPHQTEPSAKPRSPEAIK